MSFGVNACAKPAMTTVCAREIHRYIYSDAGGAVLAATEGGGFAMVIGAGETSCHNRAVNQRVWKHRETRGD